MPKDALGNRLMLHVIRQVGEICHGLLRVLRFAPSRCKAVQ